MNTADATCRSCSRQGLLEVLDLGTTPLADGLLREEQLGAPEPAFPLEVAFCPDCALLQILETVPPEVLFNPEYPYFSSFSDYLLQHSRENVLDLIERRGLDAGSFVVEVASNDGYLLKNYVQAGIPVMGIEPTPNTAQAAEKVGVPSLVEFFTDELAARLRDEGKQADVIHGNNVLAHVADTNGFVSGLGTLLKDDGVIVIEAPYVRDLIDHCEFDTIYHEHLCYFSVTALDNLFRRHSLFLNDVKRLSIHGGSLRLYVEKTENVGPAVRRLLDEERQLGIDAIGYYRDFSTRVQNLKQSLKSMLDELKAEGKTIAAYGAAAKGSTMINYVGIGTETVDFVVDSNVHKQGMHMPGKHLPILPAEEILARMPDYVLLLPWNFEAEILEQQAAYLAQGGRFIIPVPQPRIVCETPV